MSTKQFIALGTCSAGLNRLLTPNDEVCINIKEMSSQALFVMDTAHWIIGSKKADISTQQVRKR